MSNLLLNKFTKIILCFIVASLFATNALAEKVEQGMIAPDFSIQRLDGTQFNLSDYKGKKSVYMVFWTTWCVHCMKKIPKLKFYQDLYGKQIEIIAIDTSVRDSLAKAYKFQKERQINYPLAYDHRKNVTDRYDVWGTPTEFIIDINGKIIHRDGVPNNISEHLSNWNMIDKKTLNKVPNSIVQI